MRRWLPILLVFVSFGVQADEGMWPPAQLPELSKTLRTLGLQIDPRVLSDLTAQPMNAVVSLGGCTASFVSPDGLVITNHHCAFGALQYNSTKDHNLLTDGFIATSRGDEVFAGPGSRVLVTVMVKDVTDKVLGHLSGDLSGRERYQAIEDQQKSLVAACEKDEGHRCRVAAFYGGLQYQLVKQIELRDVRLVYAPPQGVGKFGGDIDNWMWPRHTGDFSFYRAYVGPDGAPADPDEKNVPYHPAHFLHVSPAGVDEGDFVMVAGYPGRTNRYRLASEVDNVIHWTYPERKKAFGEFLTVIEEATRDRPEARLEYASLVAGLNNVKKNNEGLLAGFAHSDVVSRKVHLEKNLQAWIDANPERQDRYRTSIQDVRDLAAQSRSDQERDLYYQFLAHRSSLLGAAQTLYRLSREQQKKDSEREPGFQERDLMRIRERLTRLDRTFDPEVDRAVWRHFIVRYAAIPTDLHAAVFDDWFGIHGHTVDEARLDARLTEMYEKTSLGEKEARLKWIGKRPDAFAGSEDPFLRLAVTLYDSDMALEEESKSLAGHLREARPRFMEALIAYLGEQGKAVYPDANSTLRVTFGQVEGSEPADGLRNTPFTTLAGVVAKDTGKEPFDTPPQLLAAMRQPGPQRFAAPVLGTVPVNFLSTLDTTGGNSGSPTLDARGNLVGLLFDGTYESIISDWDFLPDKTRSIHVDIRYVLWVMDQIGGASRLFEEMGIEPAASLRAGRGR
ncbi:MAG: S46 family peptidase [Acidobacteriota bacterium]